MLTFNPHHYYQLSFWDAVCSTFTSQKSIFPPSASFTEWMNWSLSCISGILLKILGNGNSLLQVQAIRPRVSKMGDNICRFQLMLWKKVLTFKTSMIYIWSKHPPQIIYIERDNHLSCCLNIFLCLNIFSNWMPVVTAFVKMHSGLEQTRMD